MKLQRNYSEYRQAVKFRPLHIKLKIVPGMQILYLQKFEFFLDKVEDISFLLRRFRIIYHVPLKSYSRPKIAKKAVFGSFNPLYHRN